MWDRPECSAGVFCFFRNEEPENAKKGETKTSFLYICCCEEFTCWISLFLSVALHEGNAVSFFLRIRSPSFWV